MILVDETTVALAALPLAQFKDHMRLGSGFVEDDLQDGLLESFLRAAITAVEARTAKILLQRSFRLTLTEQATAGPLWLPVAPVTTLTSLTQVDEDGVETPVDPDRSRLLDDAHRPCVTGKGGPVPGVPFGGALIVRFEAGFGVTWAELPADLAQAVMMLAAHYYEFRNETALGAGCMPFGVTALIERYRHIRLFGGRT